MLCTYLCAATFSSWITLSHCGFKYADDDGGYKYCWTRKFVRRYEPHQVREQAISALKEKFNSSFCDISYILTIDPWLKHNQTRYKVFIIAEHFVNQSINQRHEEIKELLHPILNNPGDSRVEIIARTLEEKPEGLFTEKEMNYHIHYLDEQQIPIFGGNRLKRDVKEFVVEPEDMSWKFHPNKTCQLVEEIIRKKFDPVLVSCESLKDQLIGKVGPGHEDQYKLLVVSDKFLDVHPLRRTINVRKSIEELITQQMYKIHMTLKTPEEYEAEKDIETTTNFSKYM